MSTAVLISGHARTFRHTFANQYWMVLRHYSDVTIFASVVQDEDASALELLTTRFPSARVHIETVVQPTRPQPPGPPQVNAPASNWITSLASPRGGAVTAAATTASPSWATKPPTPIFRLSNTSRP